MYTISGRPQTQAGSSFHQNCRGRRDKHPLSPQNCHNGNPTATCDQVREHSPELPQMKKQLRHCAYKKSHASQEQPHSRLSLFQATFRFPSRIPPSQHLHRPQHQMKMESKRKKKARVIFIPWKHIWKNASVRLKDSEHIYLYAAHTLSITTSAKMKYTCKHVPWGEFVR